MQAMSVAESGTVNTAGYDGHAYKVPDDEQDQQDSSDESDDIKD